VIAAPPDRNIELTALLRGHEDSCPRFVVSAVQARGREAIPCRVIPTGNSLATILQAPPYVHDRSGRTLQSSIARRLSMQKHEIVIPNRLGMHARAVAKLVALSSKFASRVVLVANGRRADARHFIAVLLLAASMGTAVTIQTEGPDETEAMRAVKRLISNGFGET
jgi:phosphocarrier protein